ncbi:MAG: A/G-specific adenine glycosylase, partial [Planctomycetota bacterium]
MSRVDPAAIAGPIERWFEAARRELPWRSPGRASRRDPYVTLVSELMLQQTQAARVAERLPGFLDRFPSIEALARADEDDVLAAWSGLGYYRRARLLHAAAKAVIDEHDGSMPPDHAALLSIPGIGPYTAGAIASMAFDRPEPAVDGNVMRVLMRVLGLAGRADGRAKIASVRELAHAVAAAASAPGDAA